jgi:hypothetical protein
MAYDWRPTGTRAATTNPAVVAVPRPRPSVAAASTEQADDIRVAAAIDEFIEAAESGRAPNRSGRPYRPSAVRDLRGTLRHHMAPQLGEMPLRDVRRRHIQALVDRLATERLSMSRIRSVVSAIRAMYGYAIERGYAEFSPADGLTIPAENGPEWGGGDEAAWDRNEKQHDIPDRSRPSSAPRPERKQRRRERYEGGDFQPIALLPERILSLVLRIVVVIFILFALVTIAESV